MNAAKKGLGRGLSALFGDIENKSSISKEQTNKVLIADIERNKFQPRTIFNEEKLEELSLSIKENGFDGVLERLFAELPVGSDDIIAMAATGLLTEIPSRPMPRE